MLEEMDRESRDKNSKILAIRNSMSTRSTLLHLIPKDGPLSFASSPRAAFLRRCLPLGLLHGNNSTSGRGRDGIHGRLHAFKTV